MVGVAARAVASLDEDVTLPQYRAMVVLASRGPQRVVDLSAELGVTSSTGTRMCERLVRKGLIQRERSQADLREVWFTLSAKGQHLVNEVTERRRAELVRAIEAVPEVWHEQVIVALRALADAAGERPDSEWWLGWQQH
jgi:DNA-binding MarR family transcriptional regulator